MTPAERERSEFPKRLEQIGPRTFLEQVLAVQNFWRKQILALAACMLLTACWVGPPYGGYGYGHPVPEPMVAPVPAYGWHPGWEVHHGWEAHRAYHGQPGYYYHR